MKHKSYLAVRLPSYSSKIRARASLVTALATMGIYAPRSLLLKFASGYGGDTLANYFIEQREQ